MSNRLKMSPFCARALALLGAAFLSSAAFAGVVGTGTPSSCTEAALLSQIPSGGTVTFNCGAGPQTIAMTFTLTFVPSNPKVTIDGGDTITLDGTGNNQGMVNVTGSSAALAEVTFRHITLANGNINTGMVAGGAIQNYGKLTLDTVTLRNNQSAGSGGAIYQELCNDCPTASLVATRCLFKNNGADSGAAISMQGGSATVEESTFSGNSGKGGGAIDVYGNADFKVDMSIARCTFSGNASTSWGGGAIVVESLNPGSSVRIENDTFAGNSVAATGHGAAIYIDSKPVTITNCTIASNTAGASSGGAVFFSVRASATSMNNSIIASNSGGNCSFDGGVTFTGGHNLQFGDSTCTGVPVANPLLSPLADNGGATQTMALGAGSPAIDAADTTIAPSTDQRGLPRADGNADGVVAADIGAFEAPGPDGLPSQPHARRRVVRHP